MLVKLRDSWDRELKKNILIIKKWVYKAYRYHMQKFSHSFDWDNIKILDFEPNFYKRLVSEMLHIKEAECY